MYHIKSLSWRVRLMFVFLICSTFLTVLHVVKLNFKSIEDNPSLFFYTQHHVGNGFEVRNYNLTNDWQEVTEVGGNDHVNNKTKIFVYSAYLDISENVLRIISITPNHSKEAVSCHVYNKDLNLMVVLLGRIVNHRDGNFGIDYSTAFILCNLDSVATQVHQSLGKQHFLKEMKFVSILPNSSLKQDFPTNVSNMKIIYQPPRDSEEPHKFGLCVQPLFNYNQVFEFIQWIEFYKMMGVTHFTFYNISIGPRVSCVMRSEAMNNYGNRIVVLNWTNPISNNSLLHINGQNAQSPDCAFRYRGVSKYLVSVDVDEYIVPNYVYARNYEQLINHVNKDIAEAGMNTSLSTVMQYQFRSAFFGSDFGIFPPMSARMITPMKDNKVQLEDLTLFKYALRQKELYPHNIRSKYITMPQRVIEPGTHHLYEAVGNGTEVHVPHQLAFVHHHRIYGCWFACGNITQEQDMSAHFYILQLYERIKAVVSKLGDECGLMDFNQWM